MSDFILNPSWRASPWVSGAGVPRSGIRAASHFLFLPARNSIAAYPSTPLEISDHKCTPAAGVERCRDQKHYTSPWRFFRMRSASKRQKGVVGAVGAFPRQCTTAIYVFSARGGRFHRMHAASIAAAPCTCAIQRPGAERVGGDAVRAPFGVGADARDAAWCLRGGIQADVFECPPGSAAP